MFNLYTLNDIYTNGYQSNLLSVISVFSVLCGIFVIIAKNPIVSVLFLIGLFFTIASYLMALGLNFIGLSYLLVYVGAVSILFLFILMLINIRISELITDNNNSLILALIIGLLIITPLYTKGNNHHLNQIDSYNIPSFSSPTPSPFGIREASESYAVQTKIETIKPLELELNREPLGLLKNIIEYFASPFTYNSEQENLLNNQKNDIHFVTSNIWDGALEEVSHITSIGNIIYTNYPIWLIITSIILLLAMVGAIVITIKQQ